MRHNKNFNHLGRTKAHREAMLCNMASSLILHKRITTTVAKAKALRVFVEPVITRAKTDTMHSRRMAFADLRNKEAVKELFGVVADKVATRPGGYTRIIRTGLRLGDSASMCFIELVDFNEDMAAATPIGGRNGAAAKSGKTRRSRRRGGAKKAQGTAAEVKAEKKETAPVAEETAAPATEEAASEAQATPEAEA